METKEYYTVITGASTGIGKAFAFEMAQRGRNLILNSLPGENLRGISEEIMKRFNNKVVCFENDLTEKNGPMNFYNFIKNQSLHVDFLINNAGIGYDGCVEDYTVECIDKMIFLNIRAVTLITHLLIPELKNAPVSYIVNISSFGGYLPSPYKSVYLSTKSFIYFFTRALQEEFSGNSIHPCAILPGPVRTNETVKKRISLSGLLGHISALEPDELARKSIPKVLRGRKVIIEGRWNRFFFSIATVTPEGILLNLLKRVFKNTETLAYLVAAIFLNLPDEVYNFPGS